MLTKLQNANLNKIVNVNKIVYIKDRKYKQNKFIGIRMYNKI